MNIYNLFVSEKVRKEFREILDLEVGEKLRRIEKRLAVLECPHNETEYCCGLMELTTGRSVPFANYFKKCKKCGKIIEAFAGKREWLERQIEQHKKELQEIK